MKSGNVELNFLYQNAEQTITLKMADQEKSDIYVVFTMILCGLNLSY